MWEQGSVQLKQTSAKNRPTHLALIKTACLYSCRCSDPRAPGKSAGKENTDVCALHGAVRTHTHTRARAHLNKRSNSFINKRRKCVLWGEGAADLTVAVTLMNNWPRQSIAKRSWGGVGERFVIRRYTPISKLIHQKASNGTLSLRFNWRHTETSYLHDGTDLSAARQLVAWLAKCLFPGAGAQLSSKLGRLVREQWVADKALCVQSKPRPWDGGGGGQFVFCLFCKTCMLTSLAFMIYRPRATFKTKQSPQPHRAV